MKKIIVILLLLTLLSCDCTKGHYEEQLLPQSMVSGNGQVTTILLMQTVYICDTLK